MSRLTVAAVLLCLLSPLATADKTDLMDVYFEALAADAVRQMNSSAITNLFVVDDSGIAGLLHIHDLLRAGVL